MLDYVAEQQLPWLFSLRLDNDSQYKANMMHDLALLGTENGAWQINASAGCSRSRVQFRGTASSLLTLQVFGVSKSVYIVAISQSCYDVGCR
jgi:hypothetical protein